MEGFFLVSVRRVFLWDWSVCLGDFYGVIFFRDGIYEFGEEEIIEGWCFLRLYFIMYFKKWGWF